MNAHSFLRQKFLTALLCAASFVQMAWAGDWPQLLGPHANGTSEETGLLDRLPARGPRVLWSKSIGTGYGAPSVRDGELVLHHRIANAEIVEAFNAATGQPSWRHAYPSSFIDPFGYNNGPRGTPLLTPEFCFTFGAEGKLLCLERKTGQLVWQHDTGKEWDVPEAFFGVGSSPILEDGKLIVMIGGQPNSGVVAFDAKTGRVLWENVGRTNWNGVPMTGWPGEPPVVWQESEKQASYSTPVAATINGRRQILCFTRQGLVSLNPTNGAVNFSFWFRSRVNESVNAMTPVVSGDLIFISAAYYRIGSVLLRVKPDGRGVEEVWRDTTLEQHWNTPILHEGSLFGFSGRNEPDARFRSVEFATGRLLWDHAESWTAPSVPPPKVFGRGSAILADGKLIAIGEGGLLGLFKPDAGKLVEISRWQVPELHHPCWAAPVLADRRLYLRSEDRLVCLDFAK